MNLFGRRAAPRSRCCVFPLVESLGPLVLFAVYGMTQQLRYGRRGEEQILEFTPPNHVGQQKHASPIYKWNKLFFFEEKGKHIRQRRWFPAWSGQHVSSRRSRLFNHTTAGVCHCQMKGKRSGWLKGWSVLLGRWGGKEQLAWNGIPDISLSPDIECYKCFFSSFQASL